MVKTGIYISELIDREKYKFHIGELYDLFYELFKENKNIEIIKKEYKNEKTGEIKIVNDKIKFKYSGSEIFIKIKFWEYPNNYNKIFLSIFPTDENFGHSVNYNKDKIEKVFYYFIENILTYNLKIIKNDINFEFSLLKLDTKIDISNWNVILNYKIKESTTLKDFFINNKKKESLPKLYNDNTFAEDIIFFYPDKVKNTDIGKIAGIITNKLKNDKKVYTLGILNSKYIWNNYDFKKYNDSNIRELMNKYIGSGNLLIIFKNSDEIYNTIKGFSISNNLNLQVFNLANTSDKKLIQNTYIGEIFAKIDLPLLNLSSDILSKNGVNNIIYLKDLNSLDHMFSISYDTIDYNHVNENCWILNNINYFVPKKSEKLSIDDENINKLTTKIESLNISKSKSDIFLTKIWNKKDVEKLIKSFKDKGIEIRKIFYISNTSIKGFIQGVSNNNLLEFDYTIFDNKALIKTVNKYQFYSSFLPVFIDQLYSNDNSDLSKSDIEVILWSIKKRIYRIDNFHNLKIPEVFSLFSPNTKEILKSLNNSIKIKISSLY